MGADASIHVRFTQACTDLTVLLDRLEAELPHRKRTGFAAGGSPTKGGHYPLASWNSPVAMLVLTIHQGLRDMEQEMRLEIAGTARDRGGATKVTVAILGMLPSLAAGLDRAEALRAARQVESWCWQARTTLGEAEPWQQLPRQPGKPVPACPWCGYRTLRYRPQTGTVRCVNPSCTDDNGKRPAGRIDIGDVSGEPILAWNDGSTGIKE